ncbi:sarcosine oxidase subunit gamma family protein [uncultured Tateyamaria sp.]|uniref:sarcosine oxidase subunit gamma n=1 Tax=uncultured Tateyamaria sp. TaxID=455651 RepID=UPI002632E365|nr:sarcosine oxidase subunit gamma family protein [uncultured Tateyamaria sp.]
MSKAVTALGGAVNADGIAAIAEVPLQGMITLRGDLAASAVKAAAQSAAGVAVPGPGQANCTGDSGLCWMSPDELLVLCPYGDVSDHVQRMQDSLGDVHALAVDVSDARASFTVTGPHARDVMAKLAPVDFHPDAFQSGMFRRTRMAQVPVAFWMRDSDSFQIICFRSQARYVFDLLSVAAQNGSAVSIF